MADIHICSILCLNNNKTEICTFIANEASISRSMTTNTLWWNSYFANASHRGGNISRQTFSKHSSGRYACIANSYI